MNNPIEITEIEFYKIWKFNCKKQLKEIYEIYKQKDNNIKFNLFCIDVFNNHQHLIDINHN